MDDRQVDERVRERAHRIWLEEGRPLGRADAHWDMARELVAIEENFKDTLLPGPSMESADDQGAGQGEPVEMLKNVGEFPTLTDQGEEATFPDRDLLETADEPSLSTEHPQNHRPR